MKWTILVFGFSLFAAGCGCDESLVIGEEVRIPLVFENYSTAEINAMDLLLVDPITNDTVSDKLPRYLWGGQILTTNYLTDKPTAGYYTSDMDGKNIYFAFKTDNQYQIIDSLMNMVIKKSQGTSTDKCHENDPNIRIDELSFVHKGETLGKKGVIKISK